MIDHGKSNLEMSLPSKYVFVGSCSLDGFQNDASYFERCYNLDPMLIWSRQRKILSIWNFQIENQPQSNNRQILHEFCSPFQVLVLLEVRWLKYGYHILVVTSVLRWNYLDKDKHIHNLSHFFGEQWHKMSRFHCKML